MKKEKLLFEARCKRCNEIKEIDFNERIGEVNSLQLANALIGKFVPGFSDWCTNCLMITIKEPVTLIKNVNE